MKCWKNKDIECDDMPNPDGYVCEVECQKWGGDGKASVSSMIYKNIQYNVDDVVKLKKIPGITNPSGVIVIMGFIPPDSVTLKELGANWMGSCVIDEITVVGKLELTKPETTIVAKTGEPGEGMSYSTIEVTGRSSCNECGRPLSAPRSVACGYGPVCYRKLFSKEQPLTESEKMRKLARRARTLKKVFEIDFSKLTDARTVFG